MPEGLHDDAGRFLANPTATFYRPLFRAGDTVHMKHILRAQNLHGFAEVPLDQGPNLLSILHVGSEERYELPLRWDAIGVAETTWAIPNGAKLGNYQIMLVRKSSLATTVPLCLTTQLVGLKAGVWMAYRERLSVQVASVDVTGRPRVGTAVRVGVLKRKFYSHRKRLIGESVPMSMWKKPKPSESFVRAARISMMFSSAKAKRL